MQQDDTAEDSSKKKRELDYGKVDLGNLSTW